MAETLSLIVFFFVIVGVLPFLPARLAVQKGYPFALFYVFGLFLVVPALILVALLPANLPPPRT